MLHSLVEVRLTIGREIQNNRRHLGISLFDSQLLTGNKYQKNIEFGKKKIGSSRPKSDMK